MKLPLSMLRDFVETNLSSNELADLLTMAGFEVEDVVEVEGETVLDVKIMANRGDGLSALGLAREVLAKDASAKPTPLFQRAEQRFNIPDIAGLAVHVKIETPNCDRYAARRFEGIENGEAPEWIRTRLNHAGMRPISLLVDLTNYVLLELGQPLHAFDFELLHGGGIIVRQAKTGEKITLLNGDEHELSPDMMVIADRDRPVAVAGVMGGHDTEVSAATRACLLESAHFDHQSIRKTRKALGLSTEASYRFERSVDPEGVVAALNRFSELYESITGKSATQGACDIRTSIPEPKQISVRMERVQKLLGMPITETEAQKYLSALGFGISEAPLTVTVPSWRFDIQREDDVIEEIARIHGYEKIPETPLVGQTTQGGVFGLPRLADDAREAILRCGLTQIMSHTLRDEHPLDFTKDWRTGPRNPHSPELSLLRDSLLPGLAECAQRNGGKNLALFEIGRVFVKGEYQIDESPEIAFLITGVPSQPHWNKSAWPTADFWSAKGIVEELAAALGDLISFDYPRDPDPRFHPTRQAGVLLDGNRLWAGTVGQIHPDVAEACDLPIDTFMAELDLLVFAIHDNAEPPLKSISKNPTNRRDIAIVIDKKTPWSTVEQTLTRACGDDLERLWLFDVYEGKGIEEGQHSLAIALQLRRLGANLNDPEANQIRDRAIQALEPLGAKLR